MSKVIYPSVVIRRRSALHAFNMRVLVVLVWTVLAYSKCDEYDEQRARILALESRLALGGNTSLSAAESRLNDCLMRHKLHELDYGYLHPEHYNFSQHFFKYKDAIPQSKVYRIIQAMPKGAVLHVHDMSILGPDYMLNLTYMEHLYVCFGKRIQFQFSNKLPNVSCDDHWQLMKDARNAALNVTQFDAEIRKHFTLVVENPDVVYPSIKETWGTFLGYFGTVIPLLTYRPVWEQYFYDALKAFRDDNVMYVEVRSVLPNLYELDGTVYDQKVTAKAYRKSINRFVKDHPDFSGAKLIFAPSRKVNLQTLNDYIRVARELKADVPEIFAGFDLVGPEDMGNPLIDFAPVLKTVKDLNFFFHAGETNWYGSGTDENLIDAVLLGAKRLGHAYALLKHPAVVREVQARGVALEVNVVSNAVLSLVRDVRNHPLSEFLAAGLPVVLSSDDPGAWEADPLSDDWYVAFTGVASRHADLRMLKTLALNSLKYSALDGPNKQKVISDFHLKWNHFIDNFNCSLY
ncbi:adenosine deaminase-like [Anticarsia gemmatalis]|uniref:adenosine deaminase-like n=1 Tax=Anticarsia gemmatalis TaxID=129554 RepID=UPI003F76EC22